MLRNVMNQPLRFNNFLGEPPSFVKHFAPCVESVIRQRVEGARRGRKQRPPLFSGRCSRYAGSAASISEHVLFDLQPGARRLRRFIKEKLGGEDHRSDNDCLTRFAFCERSVSQAAFRFIRRDEIWKSDNGC